ncbi:MAG: hypothetical protein JWP95_544 [Actinotalea sp.]|nr:hypothetical protein [Actinotalea sp.]
MKLYADHPGRRTRQIIADLLVLAWVVAWVLVGRAVHAAISTLAAPGRTLEDAGTSLQDGLTSAGDGLSNVPLLGDDLRAPFDAAGTAAGGLTEAGVALQEGVAQAALVTALAVAGWPIVVVVLLWLRRRIRFARHADVVHRLMRAGGGVELFALRALANQPLAALATVSPDPAGDYRRGDAAVVRSLAALELRSAGVRTPTSTGTVDRAPGSPRSGLEGPSGPTTRATSPHDVGSDGRSRFDRPD